MPNWFGSIVGETFGPLLWVFLVAALVCGLIVPVLWLLKRFGTSNPIVKAKPRTARLGVVESIGVGEKRRLVLIRRDDEEHLLLVGGSTDLVIERNVRTVKSAGEANASK